MTIHGLNIGDPFERAAALRGAFEKLKAGDPYMVPEAERGRLEYLRLRGRVDYWLFEATNLVWMWENPLPDGEARKVYQQRDRAVVSAADGEWKWRLLVIRSMANVSDGERVLGALVREWFAGSVTYQETTKEMVWDRAVALRGMQ